MKGFTKTGQPIQGQKYTVRQGEIEIPVTVVAKGFGQGGNAELIMVGVEDREGNRQMVAWPLEAEEGTPPIEFVAGWPDE